jgi:hypothetical protein
MLPDRISFDNPDLSPFSEITWPENSLHHVEFYAGEFIPVHLTSVRSRDFPDLLGSIEDGGPIAFDLEWRPDGGGPDHPFCLIQLATSKGVLVVRYPPRDPPNAALRAFLTSHTFYGKSISEDRRKLVGRFGADFPLSNFLDIEWQILVPSKVPVGFEKMLDHCGLSARVSTKDRRVSVSNWAAATLTAQQVLYAAFDVIALTKMAAKFPGSLDKRVDPPQRGKRLRLPRALADVHVDLTAFGAF